MYLIWPEKEKNPSCCVSHSTLWTLAIFDQRPFLRILWNLSFIENKYITSLFLVVIPSIFRILEKNYLKNTRDYYQIYSKCYCHSFWGETHETSQLWQNSDNYFLKSLFKLKIPAMWPLILTDDSPCSPSPLTRFIWFIQTQKNQLNHHFSHLTLLWVGIEIFWPWFIT